MPTYVPATDWRLRRHVLRQQGGRDKEVDVGATLRRDASRFRTWKVGLVAFVLALAVGGMHPGASWGSSSYDPTSDPYSMQNVTAGDGVQAWWNAGDTGQGVDVALIDTGVAPVPALSGADKIVNGPDLSLESQDPSVQYLDTNGHGMFMAGIIGGNDGQDGGYRGVAPDSRILSVKVGAANGAVDVSQVIAALDWVVEHRNDNGMDIQVINLSYGTAATQPYTVDPLAYAAEQAWKAGIVVVTAAGNSGFGTSLSDPAYDPWVISVNAATTMGTPSLSDDKAAAFSAGTDRCKPPLCWGPTLLAPGAHMQGLRVPGSYVDQSNPGAALGDLYSRGSGTSEAAAYVTGAVALLLQKYPQLTPDQVTQMLTDNTVKLKGTPPFIQGSGELDLNQLLKAKPPKDPKKGPDGPGPDGPGGHGAPAWSNGNGSLEGSRGDTHISNNGIVLQGNQTIFGLPFNSAAMAALEAAGSSWSGSSWSGSSWSGSSWSGSSWSGSSWSGNSWSGNSWSGSSWSGNSWSGNSWSGSSWSGSSWSGNGWLGASWGR
jgi:serine protease AprX